MAQDLFGAVAAGAVDRPSARSRRSTVVIVSVATHVLVIFLVGAVQLGQVDRWPAPRQVLAFYEEPRLVWPADIELPTAHRHPGGASSNSTPADIPLPPAPLTAPSGIAPDTSRETPTNVSAEWARLRQQHAWNPRQRRHHD